MNHGLVAHSTPSGFFYTQRIRRSRAINWYSATLEIKLMVQFPEGFFRLSLYNYPFGVVVVDRSHLKELFDDLGRSFNFLAAALEDLDFEATLSGDVHNLYHIPIIRNQLTQNISRILPSLADELDSAFGDIIDTTVSEGKS